jgi:hypothetical protein
MEVLAGMALMLSSRGGDDTGGALQALRLPIAQINPIEQARCQSRRPRGIRLLLASGVRWRWLRLSEDLRRRKMFAAAHWLIAQLSSSGRLGGALRLKFGDRLVLVREPSLQIELSADLRRFPHNEIAPRLTPSTSRQESRAWMSLGDAR